MREVADCKNGKRVFFEWVFARQSFSLAQMKGVFGLLLIAWLLGLSGCSTTEPRPADLPFHELYEPIESAEAQAFLEAGLGILVRDHGPLEFPVREVLLRYTARNELGRGYRVAEHFSLTEIVDSRAGSFAIYLAVQPGDPEFYPLLAHEIGHLKRPSLKDGWEMEGFCMVFSEKLCGELGKDWSAWAERFTRESDDPYAQAYWKAKDAR